MMEYLSVCKEPSISSSRVDIVQPGGWRDIQSFPWRLQHAEGFLFRAGDVPALPLCQRDRQVQLYVLRIFLDSTVVRARASCVAHPLFLFAFSPAVRVTLLSSPLSVRLVLSITNPVGGETSSPFPGACNTPKVSCSAPVTSLLCRSANATDRFSYTF